MAKDAMFLQTDYLYFWYFKLGLGDKTILIDIW